MKLKTCQVNIKNQTLFLHPLKAVYWKEQRSLILSDVHLGKAAHFRKNGIPIPQVVHGRDLDNISILIRKYHPEKVIIVGDLFHSEVNGEWELFQAFVKKQRQNIDFILVKGNHDILDERLYEGTIKCLSEYMLYPFRFIHDPLELNEELYNITGHIHPSIVISGRGKQNMHLSCFYFTEFFTVLPSFGNFTGNYKISVKFGDLIYLIVDDQVIPFNPSEQQAKDV